jgi:hypothetical protein
MQSAGHLISIKRLVAQHTVQIVWPRAGHARFGFRSRQTGHFWLVIGQDCVVLR